MRQARRSRPFASAWRATLSRAGRWAAVGALAVAGAAQAQAPTDPVPAAPAAPVTASAPVPNPVAAGPAPRLRRPAVRPPARPAATATPASAPAAAPVAPPAPGRPGARLAPGQPIPPQELEAFVDGVVRQAMARDHVAGATVSVVQGGQVVLAKGYGFADQGAGRRVDPGLTLFRVGSITKTFTWIALMREVEAGRIRLDAPVNIYLPEAVQVRDQGFDQPVRVHNLLSHTPGFEDRALGQLFERDPARIRPLQTWLRQERVRRVRPAGAAPAYSNYGAALAGEMLANVTGAPWQALVEREVITPLGMSGTSVREPYPPRADLPAPMPAALAARLSKGYRWTGAGYAETPLEFITQDAPAGVMSSTALDMGRYMNAILAGGTLNGVTIYGPRAAQAFRTVIDRPFPGAAGFAHGFQEVRLPGGFFGYGHGGAVVPHQSNLITVPDLNLGVFISTNTDGGARVAAELPAAVVSRFYGPPTDLPAAAPGWTPRAADYAGAWLSNRRAYGGLEGFLYRLFEAPLQVSVAESGALTLKGGSSRLYQPAARPGLFLNDAGGVLAFELDEGGRARRFIHASGTYTGERAGLLDNRWLLLGLAVAVGFAAAATLIGLLTRDRRDFRQTSLQERASLLQTITAGLWLAAFVTFGLFGMQAADPSELLFHWPSPLLVTASSAALVASVLGLVTAIMAPGVWRGGRRLDSWSGGRKLRFTLTSVLYVAFGALLLLLGALAPWSG